MGFLKNKAPELHCRRKGRQVRCVTEPWGFAGGIQQTQRNATTKKGGGGGVCNGGKEGSEMQRDEQQAFGSGWGRMSAKDPGVVSKVQWESD